MFHRSLHFLPALALLAAGSLSAAPASDAQPACLASPTNLILTNTRILFAAGQLSQMAPGPDASTTILNLLGLIQGENAYVLSCVRDPAPPPPSFSYPNLGNAQLAQDTLARVQETTDELIAASTQPQNIPQTYAEILWQNQQILAELFYVRANYE